MRKQIEVFSDGSGQTSNTDGGWAWVIVVDDIKHSEGSGHSPKATNNDMELEAAIQGLESASKIVALQEMYNVPVEFTLVSDSQIVLGWANGSYRFKQEHKIEKYNKLRYLMIALKAKTRWVKGHSGDEHNTRCDKLANSARLRAQTKDLDKPNPMLDTRIGTKKTATTCFWFNDVLKIVDLENNIVEDYNREVHGKRGSAIEIREDKSR